MSVNKEVKTTLTTEVQGEEKISTYIDKLKELLRTGQMVDAETRKMGREGMAQAETVRLLGRAYDRQNTTMFAAGNAFNSLGRTVNMAQNMFMQYNIMQIRLIATQDQVIQSQYAYNQAVLSFGPTSQQARLALDRLHIAQRQSFLAQVEYNFMIAGFILQAPGMVFHLSQMVNQFRALFTWIAINTSATRANTASQAINASVAVSGSIATVGAQTVEGASVTRLTWLYRALGAAKAFAAAIGPWGMVGIAAGVAAAVAAPMIMQAMAPQQPQAQQQLQAYGQARAEAGTVYDMKNINFYGDIEVNDPMEVSKVVDRVGKGFREGGAAVGVGHDMGASTGG